MADHVIRISEEEAASNFADVKVRVSAGAEVAAEPHVPLLSESLRLARPCFQGQA